MTSPPMANANGKRPLSTIDGNGESQAQSQPLSTPIAYDAIEVRKHEASGYTWTVPEDAPGWGWNNKRAVEDAKRAWDGLLYKDQRVANRYGDPCEMADSEAALLASRAQR